MNKSTEKPDIAEQVRYALSVITGRAAPVEPRDYWLLQIDNPDASQSEILEAAEDILFEVMMVALPKPEIDWKPAVVDLLTRIRDAGGALSLAAVRLPPTVFEQAVKENVLHVGMGGAVRWGTFAANVLADYGDKSKGEVDGT